MFFFVVICHGISHWFGNLKMVLKELIASGKNEAILKQYKGLKTTFHGHRCKKKMFSKPLENEGFLYKIGTSDQKNVTNENDRGIKPRSLVLERPTLDRKKVGIFSFGE